MSISESIAIRNNKKLAWEKDFELNYTQAANHIVQRFAKECFAELVKSVTDPYKKLYSSERKYSKSLSIDITDEYDIDMLHICLNETKLPPFIEWVKEFRRRGNSAYDYGYFRKLMNLVGKAAEPVLQQTCGQLAATCIIEGNKLNFEATYDPNSIKISISFWFDSATLPYQSSLIKEEKEAK